LHDRAAGYGVVRFNKISRDITLENWSRYSNRSEGGKPYDGWPVTMNQEDNYGRKAAGYLPELNVTGLDNPVVQLIDESNNEVVYTLRINGQSFRPKIFDANHTYTVKVGKESNTTSMQSFEGLKANEPEASIDVIFD